MAGKRTALVIVALALLVGCAKKSPAAAAAAEASKKYLPPDAQAYAEFRVQELLGSAAFRGPVEALLGGLPAECRTLIEATQELSVAAYGSFDDLLALLTSSREKGEEEGGAAETPSGPDVAWLLVGPTKAQVLACLEAASHGRAEPREETRGETAVTFLDTPLGSLAMVSPEETMQAVTSLGRLDALLAAMGGGPTIDGSPLLAALAAVPTGSFIGVANVPDELASLVGGLMSKLGRGGDDVPLPKTIALSFTVGADISLTGSMTMADEASARTLESAANVAVAGMRMMIKAFGDQEPEAKKYGPVMDSISISRSGASVSGSVRIGGELLGEMMSRDRPDRREP